MPQDATPFYTFHVEHVVARQHHGSDGPENLALACDRCNGYKGPNLSAVDPESGQVVRVFHPREQVWDDHFELLGGEIVGRTDIGRATIELLQMNAPNRVELRVSWLSESE